MQNKPKAEICLLLTQLRERVKDMLVDNPKFDNDFYLYRWLLQFNMKPDRTEKAIRESIVWRKTQNIDELAQQPWGFGSGIENVIQCTADSYSKIGQPVITLSSENFDFRAAVQKFGKDAFRKSFFQCFAKGEKLLMEQSQYKSEQKRRSGTNVNSPENENAGEGYDESWFYAAGINIVSYKNYSLSSATYVEGMQLYLECIKAVLNYFPTLSNVVYLVNLNTFSNTVCKIIKPILQSDAFRLEFFDTNKKKWFEALTEKIDPDQLPPYFGGIKVDVKAS